ncbi:MAG: 30S ribosomal protein S17 [Candidatus Woesebacteria bacterium GW2011_GWA2_40_7b]|uniref:Small ribosomal subunit protein uS17 n=1 Tax=Candidatus Woesebacteria bacterium GW2011_GWA2_40_7b TaxID=1618563 RepID=A0A0G0T2R2_9BACT|nr:MAG: 30S ribosomal protein S17 [Candidatus Woesebacteria bacterium GW2011_GWA2_40_7b]
MKIFTGRVTATKMAKTATVAVERVVIHPMYKKRFRRDTKFQVHDELGVKIGDLVRFTASKPYSKTKKWKILEVVSDKKVPSETAKASHRERKNK